jgi:hypothetical protein
MKKKLLFIAPDHFDFYKVTLDGFIKYSDHEVTMVVYNENKYLYKHLGEKIFNFFSKNLFGINLKKVKAKKIFINTIKKNAPYDIFYANRPDILSEEIMNLAITSSEKSIVNYWDSFEKIKGQQETMKYFDVCFSFDQHDCIAYNMHKSYNFYYIDNPIPNPEFEVYFLGTFDNRFEKLKKIVANLSERGKKVHAKLYSSFDQDASKNSSENISFINKIIPYPESYHYNVNTQIILDVQHDSQVGLSFRPFEAIGLKKKLITTNPEIKKYDFYNSNNIYILTNDSFEVPDSFFETPYEDLPLEIYNKYHLKNWVREILSDSNR